MIPPSVVLTLILIVSVIGNVWQLVHAANKTASADHVADTATAANVEWESTAMALQSSLAQCQQQWALQNQSAAAAVAQARQGRADAQRQADDWAKRWDERTASCDASLAQMEVACAHLSGY